MTAADAVDFAAEGKVADGYACLVWGLHPAEEMMEPGDNTEPIISSSCPTS